MGNAGSSPVSHESHHIFKTELNSLNKIINDLITQDDIWKNPDYNFLSQNACEKYQIVLDSSLEKHLKMEISDLSQKIYAIPKTSAHKRDLCQKISNHYLRILYVISLIKYVYNIEKDGDYSIAGIVFRNIKIVDDIMEIKYCDVPHKSLVNKNIGKSHKVDFSKLEGMKFFSNYFLDRNESRQFLGLIQSILGKTNKSKLNNEFCNLIVNSPNINIQDLEKSYFSRYNQKLNCKNFSKNKNFTGKTTKQVDADLYLEIPPDNPVFSKELCLSIQKIFVKTSHKKIMESYRQMQKNYKTNVASIESILTRLVVYKNSKWVLKDLTSNDLDEIINNTKICIKQFYLQSIIDFQILLHLAKTTPNLTDIAK